MINRRVFVRSLGAVSIARSIPAMTSAVREEMAPVDSKWDMTWTNRVNRRYRAVFDSPQVSGGAALFRAVVWSRQYKEVYGTVPTEMSAVLVVRHQGIVLAMNDDFWKKYNIGKRNKIKDGDTKTWYTHNPVATSAPGMPPASADINLPRFIADGNIVLACGMAFEGPVGIVMKEEKLKKEEAEAKARTYLIPGVILQPSGIFAVLRAQEAGCHYILAS